MDRRDLLRLPALGALGLVLAACGKDSRDGREPDRSGEGKRAYGDDPSQYGVLYLPRGEPRGVVVVIHGGFWLSDYDLSYGESLATALADDGWVAWNLEYRRVGNGGGDPQTFDDVAAGIDHLATLDLPVTLADVPLVALGHSAGGHLAVWAASRGRFDRWSGGVDLTHVISQSGVLDLRSGDKDNLGGGAVRGLLGHAPTDADDPLDPIRQVPLEAPVWCVHGRSDDIVPPSQSRDYVTAARAAGATATLVEVAGDHFAVIDTTTPAWKRQLDIFDEIASG